MKHKQTDIVYDPFNSRLSSTKILDKPWIKESDLNSLGFRSHEFRNVPSRTNVLFAGCSVTYGDGLFLEEIWAYRVWQKIKNVGPFQNLSSIGRSIQTICFEVMKFCSEYGNPDVIVLMLPDYQRFVKYDSEKSNHFVCTLDPQKDSNEDQADAAVLLANSFQSYRMLEIFCEKNNIKLLSFSWDIDLNKSFGSSQLETFYTFDKDSLISLIASHEQSLPKDSVQFSLYARDGVGTRKGHPGISMHLAWSDIIYEKLKEKYGI